MCVRVFGLSTTKSTNCAATDLMNHLVSFNVVLLESVYTHERCFPLGGVECPLQASIFIYLQTPGNIHTHVYTHTHTLSQIRPQIQEDNLKEYVEFNGNGI